MIDHQSAVIRPQWWCGVTDFVFPRLLTFGESAVLMMKIDAAHQ
jgi:hypothetical protein